MSKPNKRHSEWCKGYKSRGQREINKAIKQKRHEKRVADLAKRKEEGKTYSYQKNPFAKDTREWATERARREEKVYKESNEYKKYARVFGRLDRDMRIIEEAARQEEIKLKKSGKKKNIEETLASDN